jgi:hypothetical protein
MREGFYTMRTFPTVRASLLVVVAVCGGWLLSSAGVHAQSVSEAVPANYRAQIARYLLTLGLDQKTLHSAMIAKPYNKPAGIWGRLTGTTFPAVCVSIDTRNMLGMEFKGYFLFYFENGQVRRGNTGSGILVSECGAFSPFYEVMKR